MTTIVHTECHLCHARYRIEDQNLGKELKCKKCGAAFLAGIAREKKEEEQKVRWTETQLKKEPPTKSMAIETGVVPHPHSCPDCGTFTVPVTHKRFNLRKCISSGFISVIGCLVLSFAVMTFASATAIFQEMVGTLVVITGLMILGFGLASENRTDAVHMVCPGCKWRGKQIA